MDLVVYKRFFHISAKVTMFVIIANGGREINLPPGQYMLGRPNLTSKDQCPPDHIKIDVECNDDPKISRNHAVLCVDEDSLTIRDYGSKNGLAVREAAPGSPWLRARKQGLKPSPSWRSTDRRAQLGLIEHGVLDLLELLFRDKPLVKVFLGLFKAAFPAGTSISHACRFKSRAQKHVQVAHDGFFPGAIDERCPKRQLC